MTRAGTWSLWNKSARVHSLLKSAPAFAVALLVFTLAPGGAGDASAAENMEWIAVAKDGKGFVFAQSGRPFVPWGF